MIIFKGEHFDKSDRKQVKKALQDIDQIQTAQYDTTQSPSKSNYAHGMKKGTRH